jgi:hypothetical protein
VPTRTTGLAEAMDELEAITARIRDLSPVLTVAAQDTRTLISDSFRKSRSPDGSPWTPLASSTIKRRRQGPNTRARKATILIDTGVLKNSIYLEKLEIISKACDLKASIGVWYTWILKRSQL